MDAADKDRVSEEKDALDVLIVGGGPTGLACAIECGKRGLRARVLEKGCIVNSIYHYPTNMVFFTTPELLEIGDVPMTSAASKPTRQEAMEYYRRVAEHYRVDLRQYEKVESVTRRDEGFEVVSLRRTGETGRCRAEKVILATGYYDLYNPLGVPGEELPHVHHYYKEAHPYSGSRVVVVGGKNSAVETALDLFRHGAQVTLVHRRPELSPSIKYWVRPDIENRIKAGQIAAVMNAEVVAITPERVLVRRRGVAGGAGSSELEIPADFVLALIGYHPDYDFLRASGIEFDAATGRPRCDAATFESNVPGLYLGGVVVAGPHTGEIFIENGRFHGQVIAADIVRRREARPAAAR